MKIIFAGSSQFAEIVLKRLEESSVVPSLIVSTESLPERRQVKNKDDLHEIIKKESPDLVIVASLGIIIKKETLSLSRFINIHPSLLPRYRGASPIQQTILDDVKETGVTVIEMDEIIDHGPAISSKRVTLPEKVTYKEAEEILAKQGADLVCEIISNTEEIKAEKQNEIEATYTSKIKKEDGKIDWSRSAAEIERKVRAFNPWPGAFTNSEMGVVKILEADTQEQTSDGPFGKIGKIYLATNNNIAVQTGKDFFIIKKLQVEGKNPVSSKDFLNGNISFIGTILD